MGSTQFPIGASTPSTTSILPENTQSVLIDGQLVVATQYSGTLNGNGSTAILYAAANPNTNLSGYGSTAFGNNAYITINGLSNALPIGTAAVYSGIVGSGSTFAINPPSIFTLGSNPTALSGGVAGLQWTGITNATVSGVSYLVAIASGTRTAYSTNGTTWISGGSTPVSSGYWSGITSGAISGTTYIIAVAGFAQNMTSYVYSVNSVTAPWSTGTLPSNTQWTSIIYATISGTPSFIAVNDSPYPTTSVVSAVSTNGTTWTNYTTANISGTGLVTYGTISGIPYFVQNSSPSLYFIYSTDGKTWTKSSATSGGTTNFAYGTISGTPYFATVDGPFNDGTSYIYYTSNLSGSIQSVFIPSGVLNYSSNIVYFSISGVPYFIIPGAYSNNLATWTYASGLTNNYQSIPTINTATTTISGVPYVFGTQSAWDGPANSPVPSSGIIYLSGYQNLPMAYGIYQGPANNVY
jgi:hypothetical protein